MIATVTLHPSVDMWLDTPTLSVGAFHRATRWANSIGGKGVNVSRVLRELGGRTRAYVLVGREGETLLRRALSKADVPVASVPIAGGLRANYKIVTTHPQASTEINTDGPRARGSDLRAMFERLLRDRPRIVALCGSLPPGAAASTYRDWLTRLRRAGIPAALDASGHALTSAIAAAPWLLKVNEDEAATLLGMRPQGAQAALRACRELLGRGPTLVLLSLGAEGAVLAAADSPGAWIATAPRVPVRSTVGAGDALLGGFLKAWSDGLTLEEALRLGIACGSASATTAGAELCRRRDVERLLSRVRVRWIA